MLDISSGSHATVVFQRLAFLIHWAAFIAFVVIWGIAIHWQATAENAYLLNVLERLFLKHGHLLDWVMMWGLPFFCTVDWLFTGKITIFPWKR